MAPSPLPPRPPTPSLPPHPSLLDLGLLDPTAPPARVLICGDADFAYACALSSRLQRASLLATCYESEAELLHAYPHASAAIAALRHAGVDVRCGVDARALSHHLGDAASFDRIVFNFPQSPPLPRARNQIQRHRALLRDVCRSAARHLAPSGELWLALLAGQGGTPRDSIRRPHGDHWQLMEMAAAAALLVTRVDPADLDELARAGYRPTGRRHNKKLGAERQARGVCVHVLRREEEARAPSVGVFEWAFDNSFWLEGAPPEAEELERLARRALGEAMAHCVAGAPECLDEYTRPEDGRRARTYRFTYRSDRVALSRERALVANARVCDLIARESGAHARKPSEEHLRGVCGELPANDENAAGQSSKGTRDGNVAHRMETDGSAPSIACE
ncbi:hypothetical protein AB1Y20_013549 [Prymnesium parvum]|uniref:25S rRNA (uridine-N(3))-methyltransferase BMT5-like domain-containing protein n=1 Tax=Prymnesium parvum TaxID=97485 RepID=A0AB34IIX0_PRYPA